MRYLAGDSSADGDVQLCERRRLCEKLCEVNRKTVLLRSAAAASMVVIIQDADIAKPEPYDEYDSFQPGLIFGP